MLRLIAILALATASALAQPIVVDHVTYVDPRTGQLQPNQTLILENGALRREGAIPAIARRVDGYGKFAIPGLWDMHAHVGDLPPGWDELFLANGVIGIREMAASQQHWARQVQHKKRNVAPYLVHTIGSIDRDGSQAVGNAAAAPALVERLARQGVDFLKVYNALTREAYFALAAEARRRNLPLTGHLPDAITALEAAGAGQKSIEHMDNILLACSKNEAGYRELFLRDHRLARPQVLSTFDPAKAESLAEAFVRSGTWIAPTLIQQRGETLDRSILSDPNLQYMERGWLAEWRAGLATLRDLKFELRWFDKHREILRIFNRKGVRILAGTDSPAPFCIPGFSIHEELELLVGTGLSPRAALAAAAVNVDDFFGKPHPPTLILLNANPLIDIRNTRKIETVIADGRILLRKDLNAMLTNTKRRALASK